MPYNILLSLVGFMVFLAMLFLALALFRFAGGRNQPTQGKFPEGSVQPEHDYYFRLSQLETKVNFLMDNLGVKYDPPADEEVRGYLARGMKINAIKAYREQYKVGLREAKDAVDALEAQMKAASFR